VRASSGNPVKRVFLALGTFSALLWLPTGCASTAPHTYESRRVVYEERANPAETVATAESEAHDPFHKMATELTAVVDPQQPVTVAVGEFFLNEGETVTPLSSKIHSELSYALDKSGKVRVIARERLAELQKEGRFQASHLIEPGSTIGDVKLSGCEAIVRGRYYPEGGRIRVMSELVHLQGGNKTMAKGILRADDYGAYAYTLENQADHDQNVQHVSSLVNAFPSDIDVEVTTPSTSRLFREGDPISFLVRADQDCYLLVLCHEAGGETHVLFPNAFASNSFAPAGKWVEIPGSHDFEIVAEPPFGTDVIQVIACTEQTALHRKLQDLGAPTNGVFYSAPRTRGLGAYRKDHAPEKAEWGSRKLAISTGPR
jgi:hypothetical protein